MGKLENDSAITIPAPDHLTATIVNEDQVTLSWMDNSDNEKGFILERSTTESDYVQIADLQPNVTSYTDDQVIAGNEYTYRVKAYGDVIESQYSNIVTIALDSVGTLSLFPEENTLRVYPNPVKGTVYIEFTNSHSGKVMISLIDMTGRRTIVFEDYVRENTKQDISFDAGRYVPGLYLLEVRSGSAVSNKRLLILRQ